MRWYRVHADVYKDGGVFDHICWVQSVNRPTVGQIFEQITLQFKTFDNCDIGDVIRLYA